MCSEAQLTQDSCSCFSGSLRHGIPASSLVLAGQWLWVPRRSLRLLSQSASISEQTECSARARNGALAECLLVFSEDSAQRTLCTFLETSW